MDPVVRVGPAAQDRADLAARVTLVDLADMNRVVAATVATAAVMAPGGLASRAVPVVRVGMILEDQVGMIPEDPEGPAGMILGDPGCLGVPNPVVRVDPASRAELARVGPGSREATDLSLGRALLGRMLARPVRMRMLLHLAAAGPVRMPMLLHLTAGPVPMPAPLHLTAGPVPMPAPLQMTPVDRRWDPTTRAVATCQEAARAVATRAVAIRRAEATRRAGATDGGAELSWRTDRKPVCLLTNVAYANL